MQNKPSQDAQLDSAAREHYTPAHRSPMQTVTQWYKVPAASHSQPQMQSDRTAVADSRKQHSFCGIFSLYFCCCLWCLCLSSTSRQCPHICSTASTILARTRAQHQSSTPSASHKWTTTGCASQSMPSWRNSYPSQLTAALGT